jgi:hypothetical protein
MSSNGPVHFAGQLITYMDRYDDVAGIRKLGKANSDVHAVAGDIEILTRISAIWIPIRTRSGRDLAFALNLARASKRSNAQASAPLTVRKFRNEAVPEDP